MRASYSTLALAEEDGRQQAQLEAIGMNLTPAELAQRARWRTIDEIRALERLVEYVPEIHDAAHEEHVTGARHVPADDTPGCQKVNNCSHNVRNCAQPTARNVPLGRQTTAPIGAMRVETVEEYLRRGGTVKVLKTREKKERAPKQLQAVFLGRLSHRFESPLEYAMRREAMQQRQHDFRAKALDLQVQGYSISEISRRLDLTTDRVKKALYRNAA